MPQLSSDVKLQFTVTGQVLLREYVYLSSYAGKKNIKMLMAFIYEFNWFINYTMSIKFLFPFAFVKFCLSAFESSFVI